MAQCEEMDTDSQICITEVKIEGIGIEGDTRRYSSTDVKQELIQLEDIGKGLISGKGIKKEPLDVHVDGVPPRNSKYFKHKSFAEKDVKEDLLHDKSVEMGLFSRETISKKSSDLENFVDIEIKVEEVYSKRDESETAKSVNNKEPSDATTPEICSLAEARPSTESTLNKHIRTHTRDKYFECLVCHRKCNAKGDLNTHLRTHTGERPFECEVCQQRFNVKAHLTAHLRIHTGEKPYECETCQKRFSRQSTLRVHLKTHTKREPFECEFCHRKYIRKITLDNHISVQHWRKINKK